MKNELIEQAQKIYQSAVELVAFLAINRPEPGTPECKLFRDTVTYCRNYKKSFDKDLKAAIKAHKNSDVEWAKKVKPVEFWEGKNNEK